MIEFNGQRLHYFIDNTYVYYGHKFIVELTFSYDEIVELQKLELVSGVF